MEAGARRALETEPFHERHRAMMPRTHGDAVARENLRDIMRMHAIERE